MYYHVENQYTGKVHIWRLPYDEAVKWLRNYRGIDKRDLVIR